MINNLTMPDVQVGQVKSFGPIGPKYQVTGYGRRSEGGEWLVPIRVLESGEELEYRYSGFSRDPKAG